MKKVAVITGGAGGMGLATARILGRDHTVLISDVNAEGLDRATDELRGLGIECDATTCDVADRPSVDELASTATSLGTIATVVHTAGLSPQMASAEVIMRVNALGTVNVARAFLPHAHDGFSIVNVASSAGHLSAPFPFPKRAYARALTDPETAVDKMLARCKLAPQQVRAGLAYAISKHFVIWLSRELAGPLGDNGARIVSVSPGAIDTEMGRLEEESGSGELARRSALGRFGTVDEIAEVLAFCAGDKPGYLSGIDILVDGGASATMTFKDTIAMARKA